MSIRNLAFLVTLVAVAVVVSACSSSEPPKAVLPDQAPVKTSPDGSAKEGSSYRIEPPNKNDPRFKMDPKLAGGN